MTNSIRMFKLMTRIIRRLGSIASFFLNAFSMSFIKLLSLTFRAQSAIIL